MVCFAVFYASFKVLASAENVCSNFVSTGLLLRIISPGGEADVNGSSILPLILPSELPDEFILLKAHFCSVIISTADGKSQG